MEIFFSQCIFFLIYLRTDINFTIKKQSKILENSKEREVRREANDSSLKCNLLLGQIILKKNHSPKFKQWILGGKGKGAIW